MPNYKYRIVKISNAKHFDGRFYYQIEYKPNGILSFIIHWSYYDTFSELNEAVAKCKTAINKDKETPKPITKEVMGVYLP